MTGGWKTLFVLLRFARTRSRARGKHQQKLLRHRAEGKPAVNWGPIALVMAFLIGCLLHGTAGWVVLSATNAAAEVEAAKRGLLVVNRWGMDDIRKAERELEGAKAHLEGLQARERALMESGARADAMAERRVLAREIPAAEARLKGVEQRISEGTFKYLSTDMQSRREARDEWNRKAVAQFQRLGSAGFTTQKALSDQRQGGGTFPLAAAMETLFVLLWFVMLAFQGEGIELDFQRRRHPMWEWLLSHPVRPGTVFAAEMLAPLAANPFFLSAPVFWVMRYMWHYDGPLAVLAGLGTGIAVALAACCFSKALEIAAMVRLPPRTRGAVLGILSWLGYASLFATLVLVNAPGLLRTVARGLDVIVSRVPLPSVGGWSVGFGLGSAALWKGVLVCFGGSAVVLLASVAFSAWAANRGLAGLSGSAPTAPVALGMERSRRWLRDPLHRKELLWFWRDRGAVVQVILIPLTMAGFQAFNFRNLMEVAGHSWHVLAGLSVLMGTYFLFILGPRSLLSEGPALWLPLTWPLGLESLLKAKAHLWWMIATVVVGLVLVIAALLYPQDAWRIALIGVGWFLFSGSLAEKTVTLVTASSASGEPEPVPRGRRWAAMLGTFTFAIGVLSQQWALAFTGIVYSWITSAAMWQNFRARLPFLFDPWSEKLPPAPTLMHAMIAISAMVEVMALFMGGAMALAGKEHQMLARAIGYALVGTATWLITSRWLRSRDVMARSIWHWEPSAKEDGVGVIIEGATVRLLHHGKWALGGGVVLGLLGCAWQWLWPHLPGVGDAFREGIEHVRTHPSERWWMFVMAVLFAPVAEEYLFRGLLFRALDREWGGWRAMAASSLFFAIYHPPPAWLPVAIVGLFNAWAYQRTRSLAVCVIVHAIYNAIVVLTI
jgi:membrane protease YdiL (CAAX protease family)